jgi:hypothetical protein
MRKAFILACSIVVIGILVIGCQNPTGLVWEENGIQTVAIDRVASAQSSGVRTTATSNVEFVTVDFSEYHNAMIQYHVPGCPIGQVDFGGVPFDIPEDGYNFWSSWYGGGPGTDVRAIEIDVCIDGALEVHTLVNTDWGTPGGPFTWIEFFGTDGAYYRKDLYANDDIRDHSPYNRWASIINGVTSINVFTNPAGDVLDKQHILLPDEFLTQTLYLVRFSDAGYGEYHHRAFLAGLTVATSAGPDDADDDDDGFNDWIEELVGTDTRDANDFPSPTELADAISAYLEELSVKHKNVTNKVNRIIEEYDEVQQVTNDVFTILNILDSLSNSGKISVDDAFALQSLVVKLSPRKEGLYEFEALDGYIKHLFEFSEEQMIEMGESFIGAVPYANWMIDEIWTLADGMGSSLGKLVGRFYLANELSRLSSEALDDGWPYLGVQVTSRSDEEGIWALVLGDWLADFWKKLTQL